MSNSTRMETGTPHLSYAKDARTRLLLTCAVLAGPLFSTIWLLTGLNRAGYDPMRHPISSLAIGESGWTQVTSFIITGLLTLALAFGIREALQLGGGSKWTLIWITAVGIGFIGAGLFVTDPMNGYPPGTPPLLMQPTLTGRLHRLFSALVFFGLPGAGFTMARFFARNGEDAWAAYSRVSAIAFLGMFVLTSVAFAQVEPLVNHAGLFQRLTILIGLTWMTLLAFQILSAPAKSQYG